MNDEPYHMVTTQGTIDPRGIRRRSTTRSFHFERGGGGTFLRYPDETTLFPQFMASITFRFINNFVGSWRRTAMNVTPNFDQYDAIFGDDPRRIENFWAP